MITKEDEGKRGFLIKPPVLREEVEILYVDKTKSFVRFLNKNKSELIVNRLHSFEQGNAIVKVNDTGSIYTTAGFYHKGVTIRYVGKHVVVYTYINSYGVELEGYCMMNEMEFTRGH